MKAVLAGAMLVLFAEIAAAQSGFLVRGQVFREMSEDSRLSYALGFVHGITRGATKPIEDVSSIFLCTDKMTVSQVATIINKYGDAHPERWRGTLDSLAWDALMLACRAK
jgi:hypothetical protein